MSHKHTTKFVKKLNKRLKKVQRKFKTLNLLHVLLLALILLAVTPTVISN